jgi:hypothetical protein
MTFACFGCASNPSNCSLDSFERPPGEAEVVRTHGADFAVFPSNPGELFSGCQHTWLGDGDRPDQMKKMMVARYRAGQLVSLSVREPKKPEFHCTYKKGVLIEPDSKNAQFCPSAESRRLSPRPNTSFERTREG